MAIEQRESVGKRLGVWVGILVVVALPFAVWWNSLGDPAVYFSYATPPGQLLYVMSKLAALYAIVLALVQTGMGMLRLLPLAHNWAVSYRVHRTLGIAVLAFVVAHVSLFVVAASLRTGKIASQWLLPNFDNYYNSAVSVGLIAAVILLLAVAAGMLRRWTALSTTWLHRLAVPAILLAMAHSLWIGTETRGLFVMMFYGVAVLALIGLTASRINPALGSGRTDQRVS